MAQDPSHIPQRHCYPFQIRQKTRLRTVIAISFCFFLTEISIGIYTKSLALVADAFHYLNDLIGFIVALLAVHVTERKTFPEDLSFGWTRAQLLGAFFNGAFLVALGLSISLQAIHRFIFLERVDSPKLILIVGCIGLVLNVVSALFLYEQSHDYDLEFNGDEENILLALMQATRMHNTAKPKQHGRDLGILGVLIHVIGDALNNVGVIISAVVIWFNEPPTRYYADPAVSIWIALMILVSAIPLTKNSGKILLLSTPLGVSVQNIKHDLESIPGVVGVHELHVWRLDQRKAVASAHIVVNDPDMASFMKMATIIQHCLHAYGVHSATLQPELSITILEKNTETEEMNLGTITTIGNAKPSTDKCELPCLGSLCERLKCCHR